MYNRILNCVGHVIPVVWDYSSSLGKGSSFLTFFLLTNVTSEHVSWNTWEHYNQTFAPNRAIWAASAFKGATKKDADVPNM
jgi:hypothetical protein